MTLVGGDLNGLVRARELSRATMRNIRQNLFFAFAYSGPGFSATASSQSGALTEATEPGQSVKK